MLELKEIMEYHDSAYDNNQSTRERAADDLVFYWVSQWSDSLFNSTGCRRYHGIPLFLLVLTLSSPKIGRHRF